MQQWGDLHLQRYQLGKSLTKGRTRLSAVADRPIVEPTFKNGSYTLVDRMDSWNVVYGLGIGALLLTGMDIGFAYILLSKLGGSLVSTILTVGFAVIFLGGFAFVTLLIWMVFFAQWRVVGRYQPGELSLSHWPLRLGDDVTVTFQRCIRGNRRFQSSGTLEAKLLCSERVIYRQGTSTRKAYAPIFEIDLGTQPLLPGSKEVRGRWQINIPVTGPPSVETPHNQLRWHLEVWLRQPDAVDDDSIFCLKVLPEVAA